MANKSTTTKKSSSSSTSKKSSTTKKSSSTKKSTTSKSVDPIKMLQKTVKKSAKKTVKKHPVATAVCVVAVAAIVIGGIAAVFGLAINGAGTEFHLEGNAKQYVELGHDYNEKGVHFEHLGRDLSDLVTVKYYQEDKTTEVSEILPSSEDKVYYAEYSINYRQYKDKLERKIVYSDIVDVSINFLELGNKYTGDCTYIKVGDVDILIDAGSRSTSASTIKKFITEEGRCSDGKLEYVIATHAHQDHIEGFVGSSTNKGIFDSFEIDNLITFAGTKSDTKLYKNFSAKVNTLKEKGTKVYTAKDWWDGNKGLDKEIDLAPGVTLKSLYTKFYEEDTNDENNYSVCCLLEQGSNNYLFTGDLEAEGEASLVDSNALPKVQLFKGAHHGSYTANTEKLMSVIQPETVCICCCAGSDEYTKTVENMFPAQAAINRIGVWTDKVYVTTVDDGKGGYKSLNGNITVYSQKGTTYEVHGSNNDTILKETDWFKNNRTWPN